MPDSYEQAFEFAGEIRANPRADRLRSPASSQLDARVFSNKHVHADRWNVAKKIFGLTLGFVGIAVAISLASWFYQPTEIKSGKMTIAKILAPTLQLPASMLIEVSNVHLRKITLNRRDIALVEGQITNRTGDKLSIPQLDIVLRGKGGQNIVSWRYRPLQTSLNAGASIRFSSKYTTEIYPDSVVDIRLVSGNGG
ncbi:MAG: hypothetical protein JKY77_03935 [Rhizobiaceae bacterium]|nr:hypothetical protein [Rhizobiaceae bacterium]